MCSCLHLSATKVDECVGAAKCLDVGLDKRSVLPLLSENGCLHVFDCVSRAPLGAKEQAPQPVPLLHSRWGVVEVLELNSEGALRIAVVSRPTCVTRRAHLSFSCSRSSEAVSFQRINLTR